MRNKDALVVIGSQRRWIDGKYYNRTSTGSAAAVAQKLGVPRRLPGGGATGVYFWRMNRRFSG